MPSKLSIRLRLLLAVPLSAVVVAGCGAEPAGLVDDLRSASEGTAAEPAREPGAQAAVAPGPEGPEPPCIDTGRLADGWSRAATVDPLALAGARLTPPPLPVPEQPEVAGVWRYATPEEFLAENRGVIDPEERLALLRRSGFTGAIITSLRQTSATSVAVILRFATPEGAADYHRLHLARVCSEAIYPRAVPDLPGGMAYCRTDPDDTRAKLSFVTGDTEVNLAVSGCMPGKDTPALIEEWARAVHAQLTTASLV